MPTLTKVVISLVVAAVVAGGVYGGYKFLFAHPETQTLGTTAQGGTFNTARYAGIAVNLASPGANATSSSILNSSSNDYFITKIGVGCESLGTSRTAYTGGGLAALTLSIATSSTAAPASNSNVNVVGTAPLTIATSTANFVVASSTTNGTSTVGSSLVSNIWKAGSYLTFTTNATNTAVCTFGVDYMSS